MLIICERKQIPCLAGGSSIYNRFHKNSQVSVVLLGPIALDADTQPGGARVI